MAAACGRQFTRMQQSEGEAGGRDRMRNSAVTESQNAALRRTSDL